jgi:hypothetical protein
MTKPKIILMNGAPYSGKDTGANAIVDKFPYAVKKMAFADPLKVAVHYSFDVPNKEATAYEKVKDKPHEDFFGNIPRQAYINHSEKYMKPLYGRDVWAKICARKIREEFTLKRTECFVVSDLGFIEEAKLFVDSFGASNVAIFRVFRNGYTFSSNNDSRGYITDPDIQDYLIQNDNFDRYVSEVIFHAQNFFGNSL